jgi:Txe/YoeB family toxin of Txe-Axe toxin-antitoxin module
MPELTRRAKKDLDGLSPALREKAKSLISRLNGYRSARLGRSHRIIYKVPPQGTPLVMTVVQRKDAYR